MHPYSIILKAVAEGKTVQVLEASVDTNVGHDVYPDIPSVWSDITAEVALASVSAETYTPEEMRVKPDTVTINGCEVLAPLREAPACGTEYYCASRSKTALKYVWAGSAMDYNFLDMGIVFLSKEDSAAYVKALFNPEQTTP